MQRRGAPLSHLASLAAAVLAVALIAPDAASAATGAPPLAVDLFPIDDWIGDGLKSVGKVAVAGLNIGVGELAKLISAFFVAILNLLIPDSWVKDGLRLINYLVTVPDITKGSYSNLAQVGSILSWAAWTALPVAFIATGLRQFTSSDPTEGPASVAGRTLASVALLAFYDVGFSLLSVLGAQIPLMILTSDVGTTTVKGIVGLLGVAGGVGGGAVGAFVIVILLLAFAVMFIGLVIGHVLLVLWWAALYVFGRGVVAALPLPGGVILFRAWVISMLTTLAVPIGWAVMLVVSGALVADGSFAADVKDLSIQRQFFSTSAGVVGLFITLRLTMSLARFQIQAGRTAVAGSVVASGLNAQPSGKTSPSMSRAGAQAGFASQRGGGPARSRGGGGGAGARGAGGIRSAIPQLATSGVPGGPRGNPGGGGPRPGGASAPTPGGGSGPDGPAGGANGSGGSNGRRAGAINRIRTKAGPAVKGAVQGAKAGASGGPGGMAAGAAGGAAGGIAGDSVKRRAADGAGKAANAATPGGSSPSTKTPRTSTPGSSTTSSSSKGNGKTPASGTPGAPGGNQAPGGSPRSTRESAGSNGKPPSGSSSTSQNGNGTSRPARPAAPAPPSTSRPKPAPDRRPPANANDKPKPSAPPTPKPPRKD